MDLPSDLRGPTAAEYDHRRVVNGEARADRRIDTSYGIGQAIFLRGLSPSVILVAATTERTGIARVAG